jgi:hypothetical protein
VFEDGAVRAEARIGGVNAELGSARVAGDAVVLRIAAVDCEAETMTALGPDDIVLALVDGGDVTELARLDGRYLSTEVAAGFTGRVLGVGAAGGASRLCRFAYTPTGPVPAELDRSVLSPCRGRPRPGRGRGGRSSGSPSR